MKEVNKLIKKMQRAGWRAKYGGKHIKLFAPDGVTMLTISASPSDVHAVNQIKRQIKRAGLTI